MVKNKQSRQGNASNLKYSSVIGPFHSLTPPLHAQWCTKFAQCRNEQTHFMPVLTKPPTPTPDGVERHHTTRASNRFTRVSFEEFNRTSNRQTCFSTPWVVFCHRAYFGHLSVPHFRFLSPSTPVFSSYTTSVVSYSSLVPPSQFAVPETSEGQGR